MIADIEALQGLIKVGSLGADLSVCLEVGVVSADASQQFYILLQDIC